MKSKQFLDEIEEAVNELWSGWPPRITLNGWWWKKFIPHFQRQQEALQTIIDRDWERTSEEMRSIINENLRKDVMNSRNTRNLRPR